MSFKEWWNDERTTIECIRDFNIAWEGFIKELSKALNIRKILNWISSKLSKFNR